MEKTEIEVVAGEIFRDQRGQISSLNNFDFEEVRRCYILHHPDVSVVRGWHAHQQERKWFYCTKGAFTLALVKIDDWDNPSTELVPEIFQLSAEKSEIVCVPAGYANGIKALTPDSILTVYSDKLLSEALHDSWRYVPSKWMDWSKY
ncbi:MAG: WxcM-like domain-containing protein [Bacteroidaceae bacterium]